MSPPVSETEFRVLELVRKRGPISSFGVVERLTQRIPAQVPGAARRRRQVISTTRRLGRRGLVEKNGRGEMRLTEMGRQEIDQMKRRRAERKAAAAEEAVLEATSGAHSREELEQRVGGPWATVRRLVADDAVLAGRLEDAIASGLPPVDLTGVANYRRLAAIDEAVEAWEERTGGGPCEACGSRVRRWSWSDLFQTSTGRGPGAVAPPFAAYEVDLAGGSRQMILCAFCAGEARRHGGLDGHAQRVLAALAGLSSTSGMTKRALFACERSGLGDGSPWSHCSTAEAVEWAKREAREGRLLSPRLVLSDGQARLLAREVDPVLRPYVWSAGEFPRPQPVMFHMSGRERPLTEEETRRAANREAAARTAKRKTTSFLPVDVAERERAQ